MVRLWRVPAGCVLGVFLTFMAESSSAGQLCPEPRGGYPDVRVEVSVTEPDTVIDHSLNQRQIAALMSKVSGNGSTSRGSDRRVVGLTVSEVGTKLSFDAQMAGASKASGYCVVIKKLNIQLYYQKQTIYVPREYGQQTCAYKAVLAHERQHARIDRDVLFAHAKDIKRQAVIEINALGAIYATTRADVKSRPTEIINARLDSAFARYRNNRESRHGAIDTNREYARVQAQCKDW